MKVNFKYSIMAFAALTLGLASCSNDDEVVGGGDIPKGEKTAMQFVIRTPKAPATYTPGDPASATQDEIDLFTVDVLIYEQVTGGGFVLEDRVQRSAGHFTTSPSLTADEYVLIAGQEIPTTAGVKKIFVGMNVPSSVTYPAIGTPIAAVDQLKVTLAAAGDLSSNTTGFTMFTTEAIDATPVALTAGVGIPPSNNIKATVKRLVAKISVEEDAALRTGGLITSQGGWLSNLQFALGNTNKTSYLLQNVVGGVVTDFNWSSFVTTDFFSISNYALTSGEYQAVDAAGATIAANTIHPVYCPENTAQAPDPAGDNLTYVSVRAQYVPAFFCDNTGASKGPNSSGDTPIPFWTVTDNAGQIYYFDIVGDATTFASTNSYATPTHYADGLCYFRGYLNQDGAADPTITSTPASTAAKFDVLRNVYYKSVIKSIKAPGAATDTGSPKVTTSLTMTVDVMPWTTHTDGFDL